MKMKEWNEDGERKRRLKQETNRDYPGDNSCTASNYTTELVMMSATGENCIWKGLQVFFSVRQHG